MWQTVIVFLLLAGVLVYVARHYFRISRADAQGCCGCSGCCGARPAEPTDVCAGEEKVRGR